MSEQEKLADIIASQAGSMPFFYVNGLIFAAWIVVNAFTPWRFDPFPFGLMTLSLSIEAIFLTIFVLIAQNRQTAIDRSLAKADHRTNQVAEQEIQLLRAHIDRQDEQLNRIERMLSGETNTFRSTGESGNPEGPDQL